MATLILVLHSDNGAGEMLRFVDLKDDATNYQCLNGVDTVPKTAD